MESETRQLITLLANPDVEAVFAALRSAPATLKELEAATGVSDTSIDRHLRALEGWGLVTRGDAKRKRGKRGRPQAVWKLEAQDQARRFSNIADGFALELVESKARRLREAVDARRRRDLEDKGEAA